MNPHEATENEGKRALTLVKWLSDHAIDGVRPLSCAQDLTTRRILVSATHLKPAALNLTA